MLQLCIQILNPQQKQINIITVILQSGSLCRYIQNRMLYFLPRLRAARMFNSNVWNQSPATVKEKYPLCMTAHNILLWIETRVIIKFWTYSKLALRDTSSTKCYFSSKRLWLYITLALHAQTYTKHLKRFHLQRKSQDRLGGTWGTMLIAFTF